MKVKPVISTQTPKYPQKEDVPAEELKRLAPQRWNKNAAAKIALGALAAMSLSGCVPPPLAGVPMPPGTETEGTALWGSPTPTVTYEQTAGVPEPYQTPVIETPLMGEPAMPTISIAPLFVHGEGRGAFGCVMVAPPVFLSEDEALTVINEVAAEYGLEFAAGESPQIPDVTQPVTNIYEPDNKPEPDTLMTLTPDFSDTEHGITIEFVSVNDVTAWHKPVDYVSSVEVYDTQDAADQLSDALEGAYTDSYYTAGVLYDPCELSEESEAQTREMSEAQLKAQARDFFEWLKAQGVI